MVPLALCLLQSPKRPMAPDVSLAKISAVPAGGILFGKPFRPDRVEVQPLGLSKVTVQGKVEDSARTYTLTFRTGKEFFADAEVSLWISLDLGQPLAGRSFVWQPALIGTDAYRAQTYPRSGKNRSSVGRGITSVFTNRKTGKGEIFQDGFSARLVFGQAKGGFLPGRIALVLPNRDYLNGEFKAKLLPKIAKD